MVRSFIKVLAVCMGCSTTAFAQPEPHNFFATDDSGVPRLFFGGFTVGMNMSQVDGDSFSGYHKVGLNVGPLVYLRFNDHFGASMELLFSQKGTRERNYTEDAAGVGYVNSYDMKLNYAEVPLMLRYFSDRRFNVGVGLSYGYLISAKEEAVTYAPVNLDTSIFSFKKHDIEGMVDVNYQFYKGWFIGMRFAYSLASVREGSHIPQAYGGGTFSGQFNNLFTLRLTCLIK